MFLKIADSKILGNSQKFKKNYFLKHLNMAALNIFTKLKNMKSHQTLLIFFPYHHISNNATKIYNYKRNCYYSLKLCIPDVLQSRSLKNFAIFTGKHLCWSLFYKKQQKSGTPDPNVELSSIQLFFSFLLFKLGIAPFTEVRFKQPYHQRLREYRFT